MTLKIQRAVDGGDVVFILSGRVEAEQVDQLQDLFDAETDNRRLVLELEEVDLVDRDAVRFLARCAASGIALTNCPPYIREWMEREGDGK
jgi:anti-anti-sigma regulatory factor